MTVFEPTVLMLLISAVAELVEDILQLWSQFTQHFYNLLRLIMMRQAGERLEQNREAVQFVPQSEDDTDLLDVVTRRISLEEVRLAPFLLLNIEFSVLTHGITDQRLHEAFGKNL